MRQTLPDPFHFGPPVAVETLEPERRFEEIDVMAERRCMLRAMVRVAIALTVLFGGMALIAHSHRVAPRVASHGLSAI